MAKRDAGGSQSLPWRQWVRESQALEQETREAVARDPAAAALVAAAVERVRELVAHRADKAAQRERAAYLAWVNEHAAYSDGWTSEMVLDALSQWPREIATRALGLPTVQFHIARIRKGPVNAESRKRLGLALKRISADPRNKGARRTTPPPIEVAEVRAAHAALAPQLNAFKKLGGDEIDELRCITDDALVPPTRGASYWARLLKTERPGRVAARMLAIRFDTTLRHIEDILRAQ